MRKAILINKVLTGRFMEDNIGHEIINYFKSYDGEHYIYITPYGKIGNTYDIDTVYLATPQSNNCYYIIAKVEVEPCVNFGEKHNEQIAKIKYGNKDFNEYLYDIFYKSAYNDDAIFATFKVKKYYKAKKQIRIKFDDNNKKTIVSVFESENKFKHIKKFKYVYDYDKEDKENKHQKIPLRMSENCKVYIDEEDKQIYDFFNNFNHFEGTCLWEEEKDIKRLEIKRESFDNIRKIKKHNINYLEMCKKEYDETVYTNLLFYYLSKEINNKKILTRFIQDVLEINIQDSENTELKREKAISVFEDNKSKSGRIDLWINNQEIAIIIENKIRSGINGKYSKGNQLTNYYNYAISEGFEKENIYCFMFVPNYHTELIKNNEDYLKAKEQDIVFEIKEYSEIYKFFKDNKDFFEYNDKEEFYYDDFIQALEIQSKTLYDRERDKFIQAFVEAKNVKEYVVYIVSTKRKKDNNKKIQYLVEITNNFEKRKDEIEKDKKKKDDTKGKKYYEKILVAYKIYKYPRKKEKQRKENIKEQPAIEKAVNLEKKIEKYIKNRNIDNERQLIRKVNEIVGTEEFKDFKNIKLIK